MATILESTAFDDPTIYDIVNVDGSPDNIFLVKGDVKYEFLWKSFGVTSDQLPTDAADISLMVREVMVYHVSVRVCTAQISEYAGQMQNNVNPDFDKWSKKCKKYLALEKQYEALLSKQDFMTEEAIEEEDNEDVDTTSRFTNARAS